MIPESPRNRAHCAEGRMRRRTPKRPRVISVPSQLAQFHKPLTNVMVFDGARLLFSAILCGAPEAFVYPVAGHRKNIGCFRPRLKSPAR